MQIWKTGSRVLDTFLGGGIPDKSLITVFGEPGSEFTTFVQQLLVNQARNGEKVIYVSVDMPPSEVKADLMLYDWNIEQLEENGSWVWIDAYTPQFIGSYGSELEPRTSFAWESSVINFIRTQYLTQFDQGVQFWSIVDSFSKLIENFSEEEVNDLLEYMLMKIREIGGVHFIILVTGMHEPKIEIKFQHLSDGVIEFFTKKRGTMLDRFFRILKLRKTIPGMGIHQIIVSRDDGVKIETTERI